MGLHIGSLELERNILSYMQLWAVGAGVDGIREVSPWVLLLVYVTGIADVLSSDSVIVRPVPVPTCRRVVEVEVPIGLVPSNGAMVSEGGSFFSSRTSQCTR